MFKFFFVLLASIVSVAQAQNVNRTRSTGVINNVQKTDQFGIGLQGGSYSGVDLAYWLTNQSALNGTVSASYGNTDISLAYLSYFRESMSGDVSPYVGVGAILGFGKGYDIFDRVGSTYENAGAVQIPIGLEFLPHAQRFSIYGEIAPSLEVYPMSFGFITADVGAKFFF